MIRGMILNACVMTLTMHWLTLWATASVLGYRTRPLRLLAGSAAAGAIDAAVLAMFFGGRLDARAAVLAGVASIVPAVLVSFGTAALPRLLLTCAHVFGMSALAFGGALAAAYFAGWRLGPALVGLVGTLLLTTEIGWGLVHRRVRDWLLYVPIEIRFGELGIKVNALIDTGNRLRDPMTGAPVILLEYGAVAGLLPEGVRRAFLAFNAGDLALVSDLLAESEWLPRFRVIPFRSVGDGRGLLLGFRSDEVRLADGSRDSVSRNVVVGIHMRRFSPEGAFSALLHPDVLARAS